jgi:hypothetical protein
MGRDEHAAMVELHKTGFADDFNGLARQPRSSLVPHRREADRARRAHPPRGDRLIVSDDIVERCGRRWSHRSELEPFDRRHPPDRLMWPLMVVMLHPPVELGLRVPNRGERLAVEELAAQRLCQRSILPVVVGERGAVKRWVIPLLRQIRSKRTGPGPGPNRAVNTFPLSVRIASGTPWAAIAASSASHTGRAVARATTCAHTTKRL